MNLIFSRFPVAVCAVVFAAWSAPQARAATVVVSGQNLLVNGSADSPITVGWTILGNGGYGWGQFSGNESSGIPAFFDTSYVLDSRSQVIDLVASGFTPEILDTAPVISVGESVTSSDVVTYPNGGPDFYYIKVDLLDANKNVLSEWTVGSPTSLTSISGGWQNQLFNFSGYGPGVRYVSFEDGGRDGGFWAGDYGAAFTGAFVNVYAVPEASSAALGGLALVAGLMRRRR